MLQKLDKLTKRKFEIKLVESLLRVTVTGRQIYFPFCGKIQDLHPNPKAQITLQAEEKSLVFEEVGEGGLVQEGEKFLLSWKSGVKSV